MDSSGNVYVAGYFTSGSTTSPLSLTLGTLVAKGFGESDIYVAKFDSKGTPVKLVVAGGKGRERANAIALDSSGNVYVAGYYGGSSGSNNTVVAQFGSFSLTGRKSQDLFVAKLDANLDVKAVLTGGSLASEEVRAVDVDSVGNVYIAGFWYTGGSGNPNTLFTLSTLTVKGKGSNDFFVAKLDSNLKLLKFASGASKDNDYVYALDVDSADEVYLVGTSRFSNKGTFGTTTLSSYGDNDIFVTKLSKDLVFLKATHGGGTGSDFGYGVRSDGKGNVYITGHWNSGSSSAPTIQGTFGATTLSGYGGNDVVVAKLTSDLKWTAAVTAGSSSSDIPSALALDSQNNVYLCGYVFGAPFSFGSTSITGAGGTDILVAKLDSSLKWLSVKKGVSTAYDFAYGITTSGSNVYVVGHFGSTFVAGSLTLSSKGEADLFVAKNLP